MFSYICLIIFRGPCGVDKPSPFRPGLQNQPRTHYRDQICFSMNKHLLDTEGGVETRA